MLLTAIGLLATTIVTSVLAVLAYIVHVRIKYRHLPTPPYKNYILGHLPEIRSWTSTGQPVCKLFHKWAMQYDKVFVVFVLHKAMLFINDTSMIKEILTKSKYVKSSQTYKKLFTVCGTRFLGAGLLTETDHESWQKRHVVINPAFHKKYLTLFLEQFNNVGDRWISVMNEVADGKTVFNMHDYMCRVTLDAISEVGFNDTLNSTECMDNRFLVAILNALKAMEFQARDPLFPINPGMMSFRRRAAESIKFMRSYGKDQLQKRRQLISSGQEFPQDILTHIIKCQDVDPSLDDEDLLDDLMTLFIAGQETTSNALAFMFSEVGRRPDVLQKLHDEIDNVMGSRTELEYEDLGKLEYCNQVFKEILRLYPIAPGTARENVEDVTLDGYQIPSGTTLAFAFYHIQRSPRYYDNPDEFRPERFAANASSPIQLYTYMPFSIGQRACAGQQFAKIEAKVLMCKFFQKFTFKLEPNQALEITENATFRPKGGVMMTLAHRQ